MTDYKPGVYKATVAGVPDQIVVWHLDGGCTPTVSVDTACLQADDVTDMSPLVVLDLDLSAHVGVDRLVQDLRADNYREIADQIEAQTKRPKPAEPTGLGAVIEDSAGARWVQVDGVTGGGMWLPQDDINAQWKEWGDVDAVRVLSEGVQS